MLQTPQLNQKIQHNKSSHKNNKKEFEDSASKLNDKEKIEASQEITTDGITTKSVKTKKGKWYHSSFASKILNKTYKGFDSISTSSEKIGSKIPALKFAATIIRGSTKIIANACYFFSTITNPKYETEQDIEKQKHAEDIKWYKKTSSFFGALSGAAILTAVFAPITAPIALLISACTILISDLCEMFGEISKTKKLFKNSNDKLSKLLIKSQVSKIAASGCSTLSSGLFAASLVAAFIFPPAAPVLLLASVIVSGLSCMFKAAASIFHYLFKKKDTKEDFEVVSNSKHNSKKSKPTYKKKRRYLNTLKESLTQKKALSKKEQSYKKHLLQKKRLLIINQNNLSEHIGHHIEKPQKSNPKPTDHNK